MSETATDQREQSGAKRIRLNNLSEAPEVFRVTADLAQRTGYRNCHSLIGGYKALVQSGWPMKKEAD
jgi:hypothetical protein